MTLAPFAALLLLPWPWRRPRAALVLALCACVFGATAAAHLPSGSPLLLSVVAALPLLWHGARQARRHGLAGFGVGATLAALLLWATLVTLGAPRWFNGTIDVIGPLVRGKAVVAGLVELRPQVVSLNQLLYLVFGVVLCLATALTVGGAGRLARAADALLVAAGVHLAVTLVQVAHLYAGAPNLLAELTNAGYAIHLGGTIAGLRRLSGAFPEASSYAAFTLTLLAACASLVRSGHRTRLSTGLSAGLLAALLLSTSSTGYAGLALLMAVYAAAGLWGALRHPAELRLGGGALLLLVLLMVALASLLAAPALQNGAAALLDTTLFNKLHSASGRERSFWNAQAWATFVDSLGMGVGAGATRASSYPLVLLSNLGLVGTLLFGRLLLQTAGRALRETQAPPVSRAAAHGMLALLAAACISATVLDLGVPFYLLAGLTLCAVPSAAVIKPRQRAREPLQAFGHA